MARRKKHEDHQNHEAWAIPYGDLITLLLAFFVVMYAISSVNEGKYRVLSDALVAAFRGTPRTLEPINVGSKQAGGGSDIRMSIVQQQMLAGQPRSMLEAVPVRIERNEIPVAGGRPRGLYDSERNAGDVARELQRVADEVERAMQELIAADMVVVRRHALWIEVEIRTDILFASGVATLEPAARAVLEQLAASLKPFPNPIRVEGHTDDRPINTAVFPSNWELSAARAGSVVHLFARQGIVARRLAVVGLGEHRPSKPNDTPAGRNANRRVVLVILSGDGAPEGDYAGERGQDEPQAPAPDVSAGTIAQVPPAH